MTTFLSIIAALLVLSVFVVVHELGHFLVGRLLGFTILEFAVGMGPVVVKKEHKGITYALRAFPIGGMCRFYGEDEEAADGRAFSAQAVWKRIIVVVAGPLMNIVTAVFFAAVTLMGFGEYADIPTIMEVSGPESPAAQAGLQPGDVLYAVDGHVIGSFNEASDLILAATGDEMVITVQRDGELLELTVRGFYDAATGRNLIGITYGYGRQRYGLFPALGRSFRYVWELVVEMVSFLGSIFTQGVQQGDVVGPVGTISIIGQAVRSGLEVVLRLAMLISVNLAIMNLLPLPALDGGRLVFLLIEAVRGKPVPPEKEGMVHLVGMVLLFSLMIYLTVGDVRSLFSR